MNEKDYSEDDWLNFMKSQEEFEGYMTGRIHDLVKERNLTAILNSFSETLRQHSGLLTFVEEKGEIMPKWQLREAKYMIELTRRVLNMLVKAARSLGYDGKMAVVVDKGNAFEGFEL